MCSLQMKLNLNKIHLQKGQSLHFSIGMFALNLTKSSINFVIGVINKMWREVCSFPSLVYFFLT